MPNSTENKSNWSLIAYGLVLFVLDCWMVLSATLITTGFIGMWLTGEPVFAWHYDVPAICFFSWVLWGSRK